MKRDYYDILGVAKSASDDDIKKAYRKLSSAHHPDKHASATAEDKAKHEALFKEAKEAYEFLSDTQKRALYDQHGHAAFAGQPPPRHKAFVNGEEVSLDEIQAAMRAHMRRQQENMVQMVRIVVPIRDAYEGRKVPITAYGHSIAYQLRPGLPQGVNFVDEVPIGDKTRRIHVQLIIDAGQFAFRQVGSEDGVRYSGDLETEIEVEAIDLYLGNWVKITDFLGAELQVRVPAGFDANHRLKVANKGYTNWVGDAPNERGNLYLRVTPKFTLDKAGIEQRLKDA